MNYFYHSWLLSTLLAVVVQAQQVSSSNHTIGNVTDEADLPTFETEDAATTTSTIDLQLPESMAAYFGGVDRDGYSEWYIANNITDRYFGSVWMTSTSGDPTEGAAIHWNVDEEYVYLAAAVRATGWVGFGIAEAGGMLGSDMALFTAKEPTEIVDAYTLEDRRPIIDTCQQDWEYIASNIVDEEENNEKFLMLEFRRLLNTGDKQDKPIINDSFSLVPPHRIIAAWGDTDEVAFHGKNRARGAIRFFSQGDEQQEFKTAMGKHADGTFELRASEYPIKPVDTEYVSICIGRDELIAQGVPNTTDLMNVIGFEPFITEGSEPFVHHFIVTGSPFPNCPSSSFNATDNEEGFGIEIAYAWGPGEHAIAFPEDLGGPLFGTTGFNSYYLEIHYDNRQEIEGVIDSSGVRFYYTETPRLHQVGVLQLGDPFVALEGVGVGDQLNLHEFYCPGACSNKTLINDSVTVVREVLHMHRHGVRIVNEQIRNNETIRAGMVDVWEFDQNGAASAMQQPFTIQPGDSFRTSCYYRDEYGADNSTGSMFGLSSQDEMCIAFLYYYPRKSMPLFGIDDFSWLCGVGLSQMDEYDCDAAYDMRHLIDNSEIERQFGFASCEAIIDPVDVIDKIIQTPPPTTGAPSASPPKSANNSVPSPASEPVSGSARVAATISIGISAGLLILLSDA